MRLHHLGIACTDIRETIQQIRNLFPIIDHTNIVHDPEQGVDLCLVFLNNSPPLELIAGPVVNNFVRKGILLYHTCWEVPSLEDAISRLSESGCKLISPPKKATLFDSRRVAFLTSPVGLIELLECMTL